MKDAAGIFIYIYNSTVYLYILHTANFQPRIYCGHVDSLHIHSFASRPFMNNSLSSLLSVTRHNLIGAKSLKGQCHKSCVCELRYLMERFLVSLYFIPRLFSTTFGTVWFADICTRATMSPLKWQCHEIFDHFSCLKDSTWAQYEQTKHLGELFNFREDIRKTFFF